MSKAISRVSSGFFAIVLGMGLCAAAIAQQAYPSKPIRLILPQTAGTGVDVVLRKAFESIQPRIGQPFIVDYHPGSNQMVGAELCARAAPDGHTICALSVDPLALNPHIFAKLPYDPQKDFKPVTNLYYIVSGWFGKATLAASNIGELRALAVAKPGELNWATLGPRTNTDLTRIWVGEMWKTSFAGIPYKGGPPIMTALVAGEIDVTTQGVYVGIDLVKTGKAKLFAIAASKRLAIFPNVPTLKEVGLGDAPAPWWGMVVPAATPDAIVTRLNTEFVRVFRDQKFGEFLESLATEANVGTPQEFAAFIRSENQAFGQMIKRFNIKPE
ncbi:MAG: Bug family tripartite tricarboxylate transporter substrate binding protein [Burkholderiales bacterium]